MADFPIMASDTSDVNISDVIEAIKGADPNFIEQVQIQEIDMTNELTRPQVQAASQPAMVPQQQQQQQQQQPRALRARQNPYVEIVEQPASKALRFRYECEGRSAGSIPGVTSTPENKTFPTIRIVGYRGPAIVVVSCVTKDPPYRAHPHNLVGKEVCKKGVCRVKLSADNMTVSFDKLGIQCVKRKDIEDALNVRETEQVDPFGNGFDHKRQPTSIDLNAVRLAFQVFLEGPNKGQYKICLSSIVSEPIYDKKANSDLVICKLSHCTAPVTGGTEMVLLCEKVSKEDIQVRFFEEQNGEVVWEGFGEFQPNAVHKQVAIAFRTPSYRFQDIEGPVNAFIQLRRPSDGAASEALHFQFSNERRKGKKRPIEDVNTYLLKHLEAEAKRHSTFRTFGPSERDNPPHKMSAMDYNNPVKQEPLDRLSPFPGPSASPGQMFYAEPANLGPPNMGGLRPIHSPGRTTSPMDNTMYNLPPLLNITNQLQPVNIPDASPMLCQNVFENKPLNELEQPYVLNNADIISSALNNALNIENFDAQPNQDVNLSFSQLDNVGFSIDNLSISDIVKGPTNGEEAAAAMDESNVTDSFTRLTRNTINDLCQLNEMYKPTRG